MDNSKKIILLLKGGAGSGWMAPPEGTHIPSSAHLGGLNESCAYYQAHFGDKTHKLTVHAKSGDFAISVYFDKDNNHAYTEDEYKDGAKTGRRVFDKDRAVLMGRMLSAIEHPNHILRSGNKDLFIERIDGGIHYLIVLGYKEDKKRYEFASAHDRPTSQILELNRNLRPTKPKGKPLTKSIRGLDSAFEVFDHSSALKPSNGWSGAISGDPLGIHAGSGHRQVRSMAELLEHFNPSCISL